MESKGANTFTVTMDELLADPLIWLVMEADAIERHTLMNILQSLASRIAQRSINPAQAPQEGKEPMSDELSHRPGVGIMLLNNRNEVFVGRRIDALGSAWQMPQGGIEAGEDPAAAAFRELEEEIGTNKARVIAVSKNWLTYDFPPVLRERIWGNRWRGQRQKWFAMRFEGRDEDINLATAEPEFMEWKWIPMAELPDIAVSFKRPLYSEVAAEFATLSANSASESD